MVIKPTFELASCRFGSVKLSWRARVEVECAKSLAIVSGEAFKVRVSVIVCALMKDKTG